jgi:hypothetical protein
MAIAAWTRTLTGSGLPKFISKRGHVVDEDGRSRFPNNRYDSCRQFRFNTKEEAEAFIAENKPPFDENGRIKP